MTSIRDVLIEILYVKLSSFLSMHIELVLSLSILYPTQSHADYFGTFLLQLLLKPVAVVLSTRMGVRWRVWLSSTNELRVSTVSWPLRYASNFSNYDDDPTTHSISCKTQIAPFTLTSCDCIGFLASSRNLLLHFWILELTDTMNSFEYETLSR